MKCKTTSFFFNPISSSTVFQGLLVFNRIGLILMIFFTLFRHLKGSEKYINRQTLNQKHDRITLLLKQ